MMGRSHCHRSIISRVVTSRKLRAAEKIYIFKNVFRLDNIPKNLKIYMIQFRSVISHYIIKILTPTFLITKIIISQTFNRIR
jgi:hypothetical protein